MGINLCPVLFQVQLIIRSAGLAHELNEFLEVPRLARSVSEGGKADKNHVALQLEVVSALRRDHHATWLVLRGAATGNSKHSREVWGLPGDALAPQVAYRCASDIDFPIAEPDPESSQSSGSIGGLAGKGTSHQQ